MSQTPNNPDQQPNESQSQRETEQRAPTRPPKRARRRWVWVIVGVVVLLVVVVILGPTIASTAPVRSFAVGQINKNLNGRVSIGSWSLGWLSGVKVSDLKVYDERNVLILDAPRIKTDLTLLDAMRGNFHLGDTVIDIANFIIQVDESGATNLEKLPKPAKKPQPTAPGPTELPDVRGRIAVNYQGTIESKTGGVVQVVHVEPSTAVLDIPGINQPITNDIKLIYRVGDAQPGTIQTSGALDLAENNQLQIERLSGDQELALSSVNLSALSAFLKDLQLAGVANGSLDIKAQSLAGLSASGDIVVDQFAVGGEALKGDTFRSSKVSIPIQITRDENLIRIEKLGVQMPEANVALSGQVSESALLNLIDNKPPGAEGKLQLSINIDNVATIANQLPNTLKLQEGVQLTGGKLSQVSEFDIRSNDLSIVQKVDVSAQGTNQGRQIVLKPIAVQSSLVMVPNGKPMPELRNLNLLLQSEFAEIKGGGESLAQLNITSTFDLEKLQRELGQFVEMPAELKGNGQLAIITRGDPTQEKQPIEADVKMNLFPAGQTQQSLLDLDATAKVMPAEGTVPDFELKTLTVNSLNEFQLQFGALVPALAEQKIQLESGQLYAKVQGSYDGKQVKLTKPLSISLPNLTMSQDGKQVLSRETIRANIAAAMSVPDELIEVSEAQIESSFATSTIKDARVALAAQPLGMVQSADVQVRAPELAKLWALVGAFAPPEAVAPGEQPIPPLEVTSGSASLALKVRTSPSGSTIDLTDAQISKLALKRGGRAYPFDPQNPISIKLNAEIVGKDSPESIKVTALNGDLRVASLSMPQQITVTDLASEKPKAAGAVALNGALQKITPLLSVLMDSDEMPYSGDFALSQKISTQGDTITLVGDVTTKQFKVFEKPDRQNLLFSEEELAIRNDLAVDQKQQIATINSVTIDMPQTKAVGVKLAGKVADWEKSRQLDNVKLDLTYDLAKLWPVIKPMLAPETQEQLKDLNVAGQFTKQFVVRGSYPAVDSSSGKELQWYESIRNVNAYGDLTVQLLDTSGLVVENLDIPVYLDKGRLAVEYAGKPKAERLPQPAKCNGGTVDVGGIWVDVSQETPRLNIGKNHKLLRNVSINPLLGDSLGKYVNPIFANSQRARGLLDVTVSYCENVAMDEEFTGPQSGRARIVFSIQDMEIANPLGSLMLGAIPGLSTGREADTFEGLIKDAVVTLDGGRTTQDITLLMSDPSAAQPAAGRASAQAATMPLRFQGDVNLADLSQSINVSLPTGLLSRFLRSDKDRKIFAQIFPQGVPLSLKGTTVKPKVDAGNIAQKILEGQIKGVLGGESDSPLGGLLDNLGKKKDRDKDR